MPTPKWTRSLLDSKYAFRVALSDSFNTPEALDVIMKLVSRTNVYISSRNSSKAVVNSDVIRNVAMWVTKMLRMFGLGEGPDNGDIGWGEVGEVDGSGIPANVRYSSKRALSLSSS